MFWKKKKKEKHFISINLAKKLECVKTFGRIQPVEMSLIYEIYKKNHIFLNKLKQFSNEKLI